MLFVVAVVFVVVQTSKNCITVIVETETGQPWRTNTSESYTGLTLAFIAHVLLLLQNMHQYYLFLHYYYKYVSLYLSSSKLQLHICHHKYLWYLFQNQSAFCHQQQLSSRAHLCGVIDLTSLTSFGKTANQFQSFQKIFALLVPMAQTLQTLFRSISQSLFGTLCATFAKVNCCAEARKNTVRMIEF